MEVQKILFVYELLINLSFYLFLDRVHKQGRGRDRESQEDSVSSA